MASVRGGREIRLTKIRIVRREKTGQKQKSRRKAREKKENRKVGEKEEKRVRPGQKERRKKK